MSKNISNWLITGYWGEPHVTAENDRGINAAIFGAGRFVLPVGERFRAEYIGNNLVRLHDGKLLDNGAAAGIPAGEHIDLPISNATDGMNRNDIIAFQYSQDISTLVERGQFVVIQGEETAGTPSDPELVQSDLLSNKATLDQMALWRVSVVGSVITAPVQLFSVSKSLSDVSTSGGESSGNGESSDVTLPETWPISRGGTGASTAAQALGNLGAAAKIHAHKPSEISGLETILNNASKTALGTYTGSETSRTLEFEFVPKLVIVTSLGDTFGDLLVLISGAENAPCITKDGLELASVSWEGNSVSWTGGVPGYGACKGTHIYIAFG